MVEVFDTTIQEAMPDKPKCEVKIMEMGAGTGLLGLELNKKGYTNLDALDTSQKMLDEAKKKGVYTKFICSNLTEKRTPGIQDGEYNALILSGVVALVCIKPLAFHEMMRVVSNGGCPFCLCFPDDFKRPTSNHNLVWVTITYNNNTTTNKINSKNKLHLLRNILLEQFL